MKKLPALYLLILMVTSLKAQVPSITSFSPVSGPVGMSVTISGSNFDPTPVNNMVYFGGVQADVLSASSAELIVAIPIGASYQPISVLVNNLIGYSSRPFSVTFDSDGSISTSATFYSAITIDAASGSEPYFTKFGDLNGDGAVDMIVGNYGGNSYSVFRNSASATGAIGFLDSNDFSLSSAPLESVLADFDGDGKLDVAMITENAVGAAFLKVDKNLSSDGGGITLINMVSTGLNSTSESIAAADLNSDGKTDIIVVDSGNAGISVFENTSSSGMISFAVSENFTVGNDPLVVVAANMNDDTLVDIIVLNTTDNSVSILKNTSSSGIIDFDVKMDFPINSSSESIWMTVGDLNGDDLSDIVVRNSSSISVVENQSTSGLAFGNPAETSTDSGWGIVSLHDFNGDAKPDVLISGFNTTDIFKNTSNGSTISFASLVEYSLPSLHTATVAESADLDGDGEPDIISISNHFSFGSYHFDILRNKHSGTDFTVFSFDEQTSDTVIDPINHTIDIDVSVRANTSSLVSSFSLSPGAQASIAAVVQESGVTANDFTGSVVYTITAEDGATTDWTVNVRPFGCVAETNVADISACDSFEFGELTLKKSGQYFGTFTNTLGCDSIVTLNLSFHQEERYENVYTTNAEYEFEGDTYTTSGQYLYSYNNEAGCDSLVYLNLTFQPETDPGSKPEHTYFDLMMRNGTPQLNTEFAGLLGVAMKLGDLDGDGDLDLALNGYISKTFNWYYDSHIYINDGAGNFEDIEESGLPDHGDELELFDADGDGDLDIIQTGIDPKVSTLSINDGTGYFEVSSTAGLPEIIGGAIAIGDVDNDSDLDIILSGYESTGPLVTVTHLMINNGVGEFTMDTRTSWTPLRNGGADFGDIDGDNDLDLIISGSDASGTAQTLLYINDGTGEFELSTTSTLVATTRAVTFLDVGDNNTLDLIVDKDLYLNDGNGIFELDPSDPFSTVERAETIISGDVDGDGIEDVLIDGIYKLNVFKGDGVGNFTETDELNGSLLGEAVLGDITGDLNPEIIVAGSLASSKFDSKVYVNNGLGGFIPNELSPIEKELYYASSESADFDGDGDLDIIITGYDSSNKYKGGVFLNDGNGAFSLESHNEIGNLGAITINDFDGDGFVDIALSIGGLFVNDGTGVFTLKTDLGLGTNYQGEISSTDIDGDGDQDIVILGQLGTKILMNNGSAVFEEKAHNIEQLDNGTVDFADIDNDGDQDMFITGDPEPGKLVGRLYLNDGNGNFNEDLGNSFEGVHQGAVEFADIDNDGDLDIFLMGSDGIDDSISILYFNDGNGNFTVNKSSDIVGLENGDVAFADFDNDDDLDLFVTGEDEGERIYTEVYLNNGWGHFEEYPYANLLGLNQSSIEVFDVDGDGADDVLVSGQSGNTETRLYRNTLCQDEEINLTMEECESYSFFGQELTESGEYTHSETKKCGRATITILDLTILNNDETIEVETCNEYEFNGDLLTATGEYTATFINQYKCDSLVTLSLTILESHEETIIETACGAYFFNGEDITTSGDYSVTLKNQVGCDSLVNLSLTINPNYNEEVDIASCNEYEFDDTLFTSSGQYTATFTSEVGCDSLVTLNLSILEPDETDIAETTCGSYFFNGEDITTSGDYSGTFTNQVGCDSLVNLSLTINPTYTEYIEVTSCTGYEFDGDWLAESGQYSAALTSFNGCDSLVSLSLIVNPDYIEEYDISACDFYEFDGNILTISGHYTSKLASKTGCDSLVTVNLSILKSNVVDVDQMACSSFFFNEQELTESGGYEATFVNIAGCDSLVSLNLTVLEADEINTSVDACGTFEFGSQLLEVPGVYEELFVNQAGCDSLVTLTFGQLPEPLAEIEVNGVVLFAEDKDATSYQWIDCDTNEPIEGETKRQLTPPMSGTYAVEVSNNVCTVTSECFFVDWVVGIEGEVHTEVSLYPTITKEEITIDLGATFENVHVHVISLNGKTLLQKKYDVMSKKRMSLDLPNGMYLVRIASETSIIHTQKIIKIN